jgi:hypothetical protein
MGEEWQNGKDSPIAMGHPDIPKRNNFLSLKIQPHLGPRPFCKRNFQHSRKRCSKCTQELEVLAM